MLHILHSDPPSSVLALSWETVNFTSNDIVLSAVELDSKQRAVLLKLAIDAAKRTRPGLEGGNFPPSNPGTLGHSD
jgi:hypothetical protein